VRRLVIALFGVTFVAIAGSAPSAGAGQTDTTVPVTDSTNTSSGASDATLAPVDVLQVTGLFDSIVINSIDAAIQRAVDGGSQALILQVNSPGAIATAAEMQGLLQRIADAPIPIGIWVGPSGAARLYGTPAQLMGVADVTAMVSGSRFGFTGELITLDGAGIDLGAAAERLRNGSLSFQDARSLDALKLDTPDLGVPTIRGMVLAMDGVEADGIVLNTVRDGVNDEGGAELESTLVKFAKLGLLDQLMHTMASPPVAYLMFLIGLALLVFEFFTAGVGVAGVVGAVCAFFGCFGLAELPARGWAVALLVVAMIAFAIDVQVGIPRFWTGVGIVAVILGSWFLYEPLPGTSLRVGWIPLAVGIGGTMLTFITGMPSMVRTRFATPTIGREWMIGQTGVAVNDVAPDGLVTVADARWRARTNRATPVKAGDTVRVVAIDGVTLEVEPETGAARDYRERKPAAAET
jgi:membrane-bound serine protease (ClpP class)